MSLLSMMAKGGGDKGGGGKGGRGGGGKQGSSNPNYPSTTGKPSGSGRGNNTPKK